jgi:hypothetical protein
MFEQSQHRCDRRQESTWLHSHERHHKDVALKSQLRGLQEGGFRLCSWPRCLHWPGEVNRGEGPDIHLYIDFDP